MVQLYYKGKTAGKVVLAVTGSSGNAWGNTGYGQQNYVPPVNPYIPPVNPYIPPVNPYSQPYSQPMQPQWGNSQPMWQNQPNTINNSPWGDLTQNNGWGSFAPTSSPPNNYNPNPINPLLALGTILNPPNNPYSPPPYQPNQYNGNPYQ